MEPFQKDDPNRKLSKRDKRIESKKRKAAAFLQFVKETDKVKEDLADSDEEPVKKVPKCTDNNNEDVTDPMKLAENELAELRRAMRERQKASMQKPKLYLILDELASQYGRMFSRENPEPKLPPLFMLDVQHLLSYAVHGNISNHKPRWCRLIRVTKVSNVVVIVFDNVSSEDFDNYKECFPNLTGIFQTSVDMISPSEYGSTVAEELFYVPCTANQLRKIDNVTKKEVQVAKTLITEPIIQETIGNETATSEHSSISEENSDSIEPSNSDNTSKSDSSVEKKQQPDNISLKVVSKDKFPRTHLLLNPMQMMLSGYPMPNSKYNKTQYKNYKYTCSNYTMVTNKSPMFAVDCEMCITTSKRGELTRVSVVNEKLECVYDTFVKPYNRITDYVTRYSGVTKEILDPVTTRIEDVQKKIREILPSDAILCGQSLNGDLIAIQMFHPYVIDTSVIYNMSGHRHMRTGLKRLTEHFLGKNIQDSPHGHSSVEDAAATMELVLLKLSQNVTFGDCIMGGAFYSEQAQGLVHESQTEKQSEEIDKASNDLVQIIQNDTHFLQKDRSRAIQRTRTFFQRQGSYLYKNFFKLLRETKKSAALVDEKEIVELFKDQDIVAMETNCDRYSKSLSKSYVQFHDFVYVNFPSFKNFLKTPEQTEEDRKTTFRMMDKRMWKIVKHAKENSLITVILSGRTTEDSTETFGARTFIRIL